MSRSICNVSVDDLTQEEIEDKELELFQADINHEHLLSDLLRRRIHWVEFQARIEFLMMQSERDAPTALLDAKRRGE